MVITGNIPEMLACARTSIFTMVKASGGIPLKPVDKVADTLNRMTNAGGFKDPGEGPFTYVEAMA